MIKNDKDLIENIDEHSVEEVREYCREHKVSLNISAGKVSRIEVEHDSLCEDNHG